MKKISDRNFKNLEDVVLKINEGLDKGVGDEALVDLYPSLYLHASAVVDDGRIK